MNGGKKRDEESCTATKTKKGRKRRRREREKNVLLLLLMFRYVVNSSGWFKCVEWSAKGKRVDNSFSFLPFFHVYK